MSLEQRLIDTLHSADGYDPSPDLFAKVQRSIEEDNAHRRRIRIAALWFLAAVAAVIVFLVATVRVDGGRVEMPFAALELLVTTVMIAIVAAMGPAMRRFGETYEGNAFASNPETGRQVLRLLDVAYYLIFGAYIVMTLMFEPPQGLSVLDRQFADMLRFEAERLGGLLLLMGILHVVLLLALPVIGLVQSANLRRARMAAGAAGRDEVAARIDRGVTVGTWVIAAYVLFQMVVAVLGILIGLGMGG